MTDSRITVLIADDHLLFRQGLKELLKRNSSVKIIAEASSGAELKNKYFRYRPQIMLVDISMPDISGIDAVSDIKESDKDAKALFLSIYTDEKYIYRAYKAGGRGLLSKNTDADVLVKAIIDVYKGKLYFGENYNTGKLERLTKRYEERQPGIIETPPEKPEYDLTPQEYKILSLISEGNSSEQIGEKLNISKRTVDKHRANIISKNELDSLRGILKLSIEITRSREESKKQEMI